MSAQSGENWKELAAQKEKEWKEVTELRIQTLESAYQNKDRELQQEKSKLQKLKEDFKYNLKLLEERDQELERYDVNFSDLRAQLNVKNAEISDLKVHLDDLKTVAARDDKAREELQLHYQQRLKEKQAEIDAFRCTKDSEIQEERTEYEKFKRNLQRQLTEVQEELDAQRRELSTGFEDAMKKREHEYRLNVDEMSAKVLEYELKAKILGKELEIMKSAQEKNSHEYQQVEMNHRELEKALKEKDWELADTKAMTDARISDLEKQLQQSEMAMNRLKEDFQRKHAEMDRYGREKEAALAKVKEGYAEREQSLQQSIRQLQSKVEGDQVEIRKLQWACQDVEKEKNLQIEKLQEEIASLKENWGRQLSTVSQGQVTKDLELQALRENEEKLKSDLMQRKEDMERYKKELSLAAERENSLERSKTQLELDWQRRIEDIERQQYVKSEDFVKKLTRSRDEALAAVKEKTRELQHRESLIKALHRDREQALATLKQHGISVDKNINVDMDKVWSLGSAEEVVKLQQQNDSLKLVIKEMRNQMEKLGQDIPKGDNSTNTFDQGGSKNDYVNTLENELRTLRKKNRDLQTAVEEGRKYGRIVHTQSTVDEEEVMSEVKDNAIVKRHIQSLNDTIGALRTEKVELSAQVKKQQARILYLDNTTDKLIKEPRQKQVEIDQLQYELGAQNRRCQAEIVGLRQRVTDLEVQLVEARKEADEYYKGNLERNMEVTALGQEISNLKMELGEKRPSVNFGAQELVIQQLQEEVTRLRGKESDPVNGLKNVDSRTSKEELQQKLRSAVKHIAQLAKEKQHLIEMGNRLRAELKKAGASPSAPPPRVMSAPLGDTAGLTGSQPFSQEVLSKLSQLEKLQYQLTKQQLQYSQKFPEKKQVALAESFDTDTEYRPPSILKKSTEFQSEDFNNFDVRASQDTMNDTQRSGITLDSTREQSLYGASPRTRDQMLMSMSSGGGESLQEIWKMLDEHRPSPTPRLEDKSGMVNSSADSGNLVLQGKKPVMERKVRQDLKLSDRAAGKFTSAKKYKVRNYNVCDDVGIR